MIKTNNNWYFVIEFCDGGDLRSYSKKYNNQLTEQKAQTIAAQILSGLKYMRDKEIIHRDLKPENIMLTSKYEQDTIKISDFGLSKVIKKGEVTETMCGTPLYASPEVLYGEKYDFKADLWSFGVMIYELLVGTLPYNAISITSLKKMFQNKLPWEIFEISEQAKDFLQKILVVDQTQRKDVYELYDHP